MPWLNDVRITNQSMGASVFAGSPGVAVLINKKTLVTGVRGSLFECDLV